MIVIKKSDFLGKDIIRFLKNNHVRLIFEHFIKQQHKFLPSQT